MYGYHIIFSSGIKAMKKLYDRFCSGVYSFLGTFSACICCIFLVFTLGIRIAVVDGNSMNPGLKSGDRLLISGLFYEPDYSDIVAIGRSGEQNNSFIKRVIGLPGDVVDINFETHIITINGYVIPEKYEVNAALSVKGDLTYPVTVPEGCVFVLGDNRDDSLDSRFSEIGFIKIDEIVGRAVMKLPF
jgi:signal peptidase I